MPFNADWLQTVATVAVGSVLAWGGTTFERRAQRQDQNRKVRREKAERLFAELAVLEADAHQATVGATGILFGTGDGETSKAIDTSAVAALIDLYFPSSRPALEELNLNLASQGKQLANDVTAAYKKNDPSGIRSASFMAANAQHAFVRAACDKLRQSIRASIAPLVD